MKRSALITNPRVVSLATITTVLLGVTALAIFAQKDDTAVADGPGSQALTVRWQSIQPEPGYSITRAFVGRVEAQQESQLGFEVPGKVKQLLYREGDRVTAGQILARLDTQLLEARREELRAARDQAQAELDLADIRLERITRAHKRKAATDDELDEAQQSRLAAAANLARASAGIQTLEVELEKSELVAPYDAVVAAKHIDAGQVVSAGTTVIELYDIERPEVRLGVGGGLLEDLAIDQTHEVSVNGQTLTGTIRQILPARERVGRDVDVILEFDAQLDGIRRGDLARVQIEQAIEQPGVWLPIQALTEGVRGLWSVYTIERGPDDNGTAVIRRSDVEVLHPESNRVFVRSALPAGTEVVVGGLHRLAPGMEVRPADTEIDAP
ncbi:efflux RND transporter periplasmic adaptor subunit [Algisphaera agarilytica]|uniref:RND family efflux transporter MFP subunit n=1 Tax=Algisphaera agarilytica TaxID=1385975 RepID=A0A7X0LJS9_9BACT|nr:efflux RND transporter periplasmic adaptor subunit [Algisphaera agarilytica]MBB6429167.1 RND family efflux transporter MFP subunit [Algisphaera agarilytica]